MHAYNTQTEHTLTVLLGLLTFPCFSIIASAGASPPNLDTYKPTSKATTPFSEGKDCQRGSDWSHDCMWEHQSMLWWSSAGMLLDTTAPIACIPKAIKRRKFQWKTTLQGQAQHITEVLPEGTTPTYLNLGSSKFNVGMQPWDTHTSEFACSTKEEFPKYSKVHHISLCFQTLETAAGVHSFQWNIRIHFKYIYFN